MTDEKRKIGTTCGLDQGEAKKIKTDAMTHKLVGTTLPDVTLLEGTEKVKLLDLFKDKTGVILAVPGAFTPGCSKVHLPGYVDKYDELLKKGADVVACVAVNDAFVMQAWGVDQKAEGKVRMLADVTRELTSALGMEVDLTAMLGSVRSKRYSMIVKDNKITHFNEEPGKGIKVSAVDVVLDQLQPSSL